MEPVEGGIVMFGDTLDLAENKLLLLYIFNKIKFPISNIQVTQIVLENNFMNYFTLQQYISDLMNANFLNHTEEQGKQRLLITEKGTKVLSMFDNRIPSSKKDILDDYLKKKLDNIKKEVTVSADYTIEKSNSFMVTLKVSENDIDLINLKLNVPSNKQARELCAKWKNSSSDLYNNIMQLLIKD